MDMHSKTKINNDPTKINKGDPVAEPGTPRAVPGATCPHCASVRLEPHCSAQGCGWQVCRSCRARIHLDTGQHWVAGEHHRIALVCAALSR
jgi:hypothetical protein